MLRVAYLADHPQVVRPLAVAFAREWPQHYAGREISSVQEEFAPRLQRDRLPLAFVALDKNDVVGTVTLGGPALTEREGLQPWVTGLWVDRRCRRRGIGRALIEAVDDAARKLGLTVIYAGTDSAAEAFAAWGWETLETLEDRTPPMRILRRRLAAT